MKVLIFIARFEFGGIPNQAYLWANFLKKHKFKPIIIAKYTNDDNYLRFLESNNIRYDFIDLKEKGNGFFKTLKYLYDFKVKIDKFDANFILPFNSEIGYQINVIWRFTKVKKCFFLERGHGVNTYTSIFDKIFKYFSLFNSSGLIYNSDSAFINSIFPKKSFVIKNSFKQIYIHNFNKLSFNFGKNDGLLFLHIANFSLAKNYNIIIKTWPAIMSMYPNSQLFILGSDIRNCQKDILDGLKQEGVRLIGSVSNVLDYIINADICLLSSFHEGCPNVILEYVSQKKLIVASDIPAIKEILDYENYKFLFDNFSNTDFITRIKKMLELPFEEKNRLVDLNYKRLLLNYSESNYNKIIELLN